MTPFPSTIVKAHGDLTRWQRLHTVRLHARIGGLLWQFKGQGDFLADTYLTLDTRTPFVSYEPTGVEWFTSYQPHRVALHQEDATQEELRDPRSSFEGHLRETPWTRLQAVYFASYAMWQYFTTPFLFAGSGFETDDAGSWQEGGEGGRRLSVTFPPGFPTHCRTQTFYVDSNNLIRRHDYQADIAGGGKVAHYLDDYVEVDGFRFATKRRAYRRQDDGTSLLSDPPLVSIDLAHISLEN
ncbi:MULTISPECIES: hypothetical protein [unclassified Flavobacterium]|uniref:hypothetical protein n=1 Tax=unclassified Flavobacterium TaxID=196869 RepID=UPI001F12D581|nr:MULTISPECIES: hypothetical protein [unclassified Flavobacterium]UMY65102.1 hypothetical protein MKO97_11350 [Flavobacterium sp. HJ-32-4]